MGSSGTVDNVRTPSSSRHDVVAEVCQHEEVRCDGFNANHDALILENRVHAGRGSGTELTSCQRSGGAWRLLLCAIKLFCVKVDSKSHKETHTQNSSKISKKFQNKILTIRIIFVCTLYLSVFKQTVCGGVLLSKYHITIIYTSYSNKDQLQVKTITTINHS